MAVAQFVDELNDAKNAVIHTQGHVIDEITQDQRMYYGLDEADFPGPSNEGRVLVLYHHAVNRSGLAGALEHLVQFLATDAVEFGLADLVKDERATLAPGFAATALLLRFRGRELAGVHVMRLSRFRE